MHKSMPLSVVLGLGLLLITAAVVAAHEGEGEGLAVEPSTVTAGDTVILAGSGLESNDERVIVLAGENLVVEFGTATTDAEGAFQTELTIPSHLPGGVYELRAIGDETLTVPLSITAAPGGAAASPAPNGAGQTVVPRQRSTVEWGVIAILVVLAAVAGGLLVWRAERFGGAPST